MVSRCGLTGLLGVIVLGVVVLGVTSGCGDDPVAPPSGSWTDVGVPNVGLSAILGVAARGSRVVAIGYNYSPSNDPVPQALQSTGGSWQSLPLPAFPAVTALMDVTLDAAGRAIFAGGTTDERAVLVDERGAWQTTVLPVTGVLNAVIAGAPDTVIAVGTASGGLAATSVAPGTWTADRAGFTTPQEKGLLDVTTAGGVYVACGWDDSRAQPVLRRRDAAGWTDLPGPAQATIPELRVEYRCVWLDAGRGLWLGGTNVDTTGGAERFSARLARRPANGDWFEIVLPDPGILEVVNDVLVAADGSVYLACGRTTGRVMRWNGAVWRDEGPGTPGAVAALTEAGDGSIYAAGFRNTMASNPGALLRRRTP